MAYTRGGGYVFLTRSGEEEEVIIGVVDLDHFSLYKLNEIAITAHVVFLVFIQQHVLSLKLPKT